MAEDSQIPTPELMQSSHVTSPETEHRASGGLTKEDREELRFIYEQIRKEILHQDQLNHQALGFALTVTGAAIAAIDKVTHDLTRSGLLAVISIVSLASLRYISDRIEGIFMGASFLRVRVEPYLKFINWECAIFRIRNLPNHKSLLYHQALRVSLALVHAASFAASLLFLVSWVVSWAQQVFTWFLPIAGAVIGALIGTVLARSTIMRIHSIDRDQGSKYDKEWNRADSPQAQLPPHTDATSPPLDGDSPSQG